MTAMDPAAIALARQKSSDSTESFVINNRNARLPSRKGKRRPGGRKITAVGNLKGDELRTPVSPQGPRHSDRTPEKQVKVLREKSATMYSSSDDETDRPGKKRPLRASRRTRSLSPQKSRSPHGNTKVMTLRPLNLNAVAAEHQRQKRDADESSLGSLIQAIEEEFAEEKEMSVYHQSTSSLPAVPIFAAMDAPKWATSNNEDNPVISDDDDYNDEDAEDENVRNEAAEETPEGADADADAVGSLDSASLFDLREAEDVIQIDPDDVRKSLRKHSMGKDVNNASMGTLSTATSTLSFEDAVTELFTALKPSATAEGGETSECVAVKETTTSTKKSGSKTLAPPSGHERKELLPPSGHERQPLAPPSGLERPKKKRPPRKKDESSSIASNNSQWVELVTPSTPLNLKKLGGASVTSQSTLLGGIKMFQSDASGTINSLDSEETEKLNKALGEKSFSSKDLRTLLSPTKKKDLLRATTHCSPMQVSKHTGLSLGSSMHTPSSNRSLSSFYLLERLPLEPPITKAGDLSKKLKKSAELTSKLSQKIADSQDSIVSKDKSVEQFEMPPARPVADEAEAKVEKDTEKPAERTDEPRSTPDGVAPRTIPTNRAPRRGRRPGKHSNDATPADETGKEDSDREAPARSVSGISVELFETGIPAFDNVSTDSYDGPPVPSHASTIPMTGTEIEFVHSEAVSDDEDDLLSLFKKKAAGSKTDAVSKKKSSKTELLMTLKREERKKSADVSEAYSIPQSPTRSVDPSILLTPGSAVSNAMSTQSSQRRNPPARPWGGRSLKSGGSTIPSIHDLTSEVEEESMLEVLRKAALKKQQEESAKENPTTEGSNEGDAEEEDPATKCDMPHNDEEGAKAESSENTKASPTPKQNGSKKSSKKSSRKEKKPKSPTKVEVEDMEPSETLGSCPKTPSSKTPSSKTKSPNRIRKTLDISLISGPPLVTDHARSPVSTPNIQTSDLEPGANGTEEVVHRRRIRSRKNASQTTETDEQPEAERRKASIQNRLISDNHEGDGRSKTPTNRRDVDGLRSKTPTRVKKDGEHDTRRRTPVRVRRGTDVFVKDHDHRETRESAPPKQRREIDPPAYTDPLTAKDSPGRIDPPAVKAETKAMLQEGTPTRVRRFLTAASERIGNICKTPPRQRNNSQSPPRERRFMVPFRSLSGGSASNMSETPPRERRFAVPLRKPSGERNHSSFSRLDDESPGSQLTELPDEQREQDHIEKDPEPQPQAQPSRPMRRRVVSQSPPRQRVARNMSGSLSPYRTLASSNDNQIRSPTSAEADVARTKTPTRLRRKNIETAAPEKNNRTKTPTRREARISEDGVRTKTPTKNRQEMVESTPLRQSTLTKGRREIVSSSAKTEGDEEAGTRPKTPTKVLRVLASVAKQGNGEEVMLRPKTPTRLSRDSVCSVKCDTEGQTGRTKTPTKVRRTLVKQEGGDEVVSRPKTPTKIRRDSVSSVKQDDGEGVLSRPKTPTKDRRECLSSEQHDANGEAAVRPKTPTKVRRSIIKQENGEEAASRGKTPTKVRRENCCPTGQEKADEGASRPKTPTRVRRESRRHLNSDASTGRPKTPTKVRSNSRRSLNNEGEASSKPKMRARRNSRRSLLEDEADEKSVRTKTPTRTCHDENSHGNLDVDAENKSGSLPKSPAGVERDSRSNMNIGEGEDDPARTKTPTRSRRGSRSGIESEDASRTKTPTRSRRSSRTSVTLDADDKRKGASPSRSRRGSRTCNLHERMAGQTIERQSVRTRRRGGGDRDGSSGTAFSETPTLASSGPPVTHEEPRKSRPTRGRALTRAKGSAIMSRVCSERKFAPDPPGEDNGRKRSESVNRSRRARSQTRSRSAERPPLDSELTRSAERPSRDSGLTSSAASAERLSLADLTF